MKTEREKQLEDALSMVLPIAKGYAHEHPFGRSQGKCVHAERVLSDEDSGGDQCPECGGVDKRCSYRKSEAPPQRRGVLEADLFYLLACYETDEPYAGDGDEPRLFHDRATVDAWLEEAHCGDCTKEAHTCMRCFAEHCLHKARFLRANLTLTAPPTVPGAVRRLPEIMRAAANSSRVDIAAHIDDEAEASAYSAGYQFAARYFADELDRALAQSEEGRVPEAEELARAFHATYECLAPQYGYETREETREFDPESANGQLMLAVCCVMKERFFAAPEPDGEKNDE